IHRDRLKALFDFQYRLECYTPQAKRRFGYFCLPILFGDALVGRVDCKAHRNQGVLEMIHLHLEDPSPDLDSFIPEFARAARDFAAFNGCDEIRLTRVSPRNRAGMVRRALP
ncbi:MAG: crosslink repair DNA glycosylase YcaQ family protein, partial [Leptospirales bacterium]